jgi:CheY-like chemotaxis protein
MSMIVLAVDDDQDDLELFCESVHRINPAIITITTRNGQEALHYLLSDVGLPDVVFLDINMPIMNGRECLRIIRGTPELKGLRVIMFTTSGSLNDEEESKKLGADLIIKPNKFEQWIDVIAAKLKI